MKPISQTAFYCCGVRMQDAESDKPVCGDVYAKTFMNEDGLRVHEKFIDETRPNSSNVARHRIIDDLLREELRANPNLTVVPVAATTEDYIEYAAAHADARLCNLHIRGT